MDINGNDDEYELPEQYQDKYTDEDITEVELPEGEEEVITGIRPPRTYTPLFIVSKDFCVRAYSQKEADIYIEGLGMSSIRRGDILADQWRVVSTDKAPPEICGLPENLPSRMALWGKYNRMARLLKECELDDEPCFKRRSTWLRKYASYLRNEPKNCYCGEFEYLQSIRTRNAWLDKLGISDVSEGDVIVV